MHRIKDQKTKIGDCIGRSVTRRTLFRWINYVKSQQIWNTVRGAVLCD